MIGNGSFGLDGLCGDGAGELAAVAFGESHGMQHAIKATNSFVFIGLLI